LTEPAVSVVALAMGPELIAVLAVAPVPCHASSVCEARAGLKVRAPVLPVVERRLTTKSLALAATPVAPEFVAPPTLAALACWSIGVTPCPVISSTDSDCWLPAPVPVTVPVPPLVTTVYHTASKPLGEAWSCVQVLLRLSVMVRAPPLGKAPTAISMLPTVRVCDVVVTVVPLALSAP
jgi:hypothetical protein